MKIDLEKIVNIKRKEDLDNFDTEKPLFYNNYLFHYLIIFNKLDILKMKKFPIYEVNEENMDGFMLAAKYDNIEILKYLLKTYPEYAQNHNENNLNFINFMKTPRKLLSIIKKFDKIDWVYLFNFKNQENTEFFKYFISKLDFIDLKWFITKYKKFNFYFMISGIISNSKLSTKEKIRLIDLFTLEELNTFNPSNNESILFDAFSMEDVKLFEYLLNRNVELDNITSPNKLFMNNFNLFYNLSFKNPNDNNTKILELFFEKYKDKIDYNYINGNGEDYVYMVLILHDDNIEYKIFDKIEDYILKNSTEKNWNDIYIDKQTNLFYMIYKDYNKYHKYLKGKKLNLSYKNPNNKTVLDLADKEWKGFLEKSEKYKEEDIKIKIDKLKYEHQTKFTATIIDIIVYFIYLAKKYKNILYLPKTYNLTIDNNSIVNNYPWFISYDLKENSINMHNNINLQINQVRREGKYDYALLFLNINDEEENIKHANVLLYDFKNLTVERFEPFGDNGIDDTLDEILMEELTWNTGLTYLAPKDFLPKPGYQLLSQETNKKPGDFGGFCLGWCIWYIEHRLKNPNVKPKILNNKTLEILMKGKDTLNEFIRNYSSKLFSQKFKIMKQIGIDEKNISDIILPKDDIIKLDIFANKFFGLTKP